MSANKLPQRIPRGAGNLGTQEAGTDGEAIAARYAPPRDRLLRAIGAAGQARNVTALLEIATGERLPGTLGDLKAYLADDGIPPGTKVQFLASLQYEARRVLFGMAQQTAQTPAAAPQDIRRSGAEPGTGSTGAWQRPTTTAHRRPAGSAVQVPIQRQPTFDELPISVPVQSGGPGSEATLPPGTVVPSVPD